MADLPTTLADTLKKLAPEFVANQVKTITQGMGDRASDAVPLSEQDELGAWLRETASPEKVAQMIAEGATDDEILQAARKYRHALGKAAGKGSPERETAYHEKMRAKADKFLAERTQQPAAGQGG